MNKQELNDMLHSKPPHIPFLSQLCLLRISREYLHQILIESLLSNHTLLKSITLLKKKSVGLPSTLLTLSIKLQIVTMLTLTAQATLTMLKT